MAERWDGPSDHIKSDDINDPRNPPNALINQHAGRTYLRSYFVPLVVLVAIMGIGLLYWLGRGPDRPGPETHENQAVGTSGERSPGVASSPGGFDPASRPRDTSAELKYRGADQKDPGPGVDDRYTVKSVDALRGDPARTQGRQVALRGVEVEASDGNYIWIHDHDTKIAVIAPAAVSIKQGMRIDVDGVAESDGSGATRVRASRIDVSK